MITTHIERPTFDQTVDVLVKAYFKGTLQHGWCSACAVGNLIANALGTEPQRRCNFWKNDVFAQWDKVFMTAFHRFGPIQNISPFSYEGEAKKQIDATGYTWEELAHIEFAFESAPAPEEFFEGGMTKGQEDERMFAGLMAVVNVLAEIHQINLTAREEAKALFVR